MVMKHWTLSSKPTDLLAGDLTSGLHDNTSTGICGRHFGFSSRPPQSSTCCNKASQMNVSVFPEHKRVMFTLYCSFIKFAIALCPKIQCALLSWKKYLIAKKCQPSSELSASCNLLLVWSLASVLMAAHSSGWWLLMVGMVLAIS